MGLLSEVHIRRATANDAAEMHRLICALAVYERAPDEVEVTVAQLREDGFGEEAKYMALVAEHGNGLIGMALYYPRYSTWKGMCYYLEDLFVEEAYRGEGVGRKLLEAAALDAHRAGAARLQ